MQNYSDSQKSSDKIIFVNKTARPSVHLVDLNLVYQEIPEEVETGFLFTFKARIRKLAIYPLLKAVYHGLRFIWKAIYYTSYYLSWIFVFAGKFLFILIKRLFLFIIRNSNRKKTSMDLDITPGAEEIIAAHRRNLAIRNIPTPSQEEIYFPEEQNRPAGSFSPVMTAAVKNFDQDERKENNQESEFISVRRSLFWPVFRFALFMMVVILPFKGMAIYEKIKDMRGRVLGASESAFSQFVNASESAAGMDFGSANKSFTTASGYFSAAEQETKGISYLLTAAGAVLPNAEAKLAAEAPNILTAGKLSAEIGSHLSLALENLSQTKFFTAKELIDNFSLHIQAASELSIQLHDIVQKINSDNLPAEYKDKFTALQEKSGIITNSLRELSDLIEKMKIFLGFKYDTRYLFVFQNNTELRASGGFIGSYALIDFRNGEIKNMEAPGGGSYDTEAGLKESIIAPEPLWLVNPLWHFWDANWWPDWPTTAKKLAWFYEKSDGPSVDGVVSLTPTVIEDFLHVIGPLDMSEKYGQIITADNFWQVTQEIAEEKPSAATTTATSTTMRHEPKKIIGDMMTKLFQTVPAKMDKNTFLGLAAAFEKGIREKQVLFYFNDNTLEEKIKSLGWGAEMKATAWDYLMVVNTNIGGAKTDKVMHEEINHRAEVSPDGSIINTVTIKRMHTGIKNEKFTGVGNVDWMRIYVPLGSELITADGFNPPDQTLFEKPITEWSQDPLIASTEGKAVTDTQSGTKIYNENGKTVFANWSLIDPGKSATLILRYRLPFLIDVQKTPETNGWKETISNLINPQKDNSSPYALLVQKQPGSFNSEFTSELKLDRTFRSIWKYPQEIKADESGWLINDKIDADKYYAVLISRSQ